MRLSSRAIGGAGYAGACAEFPASLPEVFGPGIWWTLHTIASTYPDSPSAAQREHCERFVESMPAMLPCSECGDHLRDELKRHDVAAACGSGDGLSLLWCAAHNAANARLGKPPLDCGQVRRRYNSVPICNAEEVFPSRELCACSSDAPCAPAQEQER
jgi:hypothetical protein